MTQQYVFYFLKVDESILQTTQESKLCNQWFGHSAVSHIGLYIFIEYVRYELR